MATVGKKWIDYSGLRPDPNDAHRQGSEGSFRYLSAPVQATQWKVCTPAEAKSILSSGQDLILNYEWYEGRMLEGAAAGRQDAIWALRQAELIGYPHGACIYFSHDTGAINHSAVAAYLDAASAVLRGKYTVGIYSGYDTVEAMLNGKHADYGWQTLAWSQGRRPAGVGGNGHAHFYQNGRQWYAGGADENDVCRTPVGSWRDHSGESPIWTPPKPTPAPKPPAPTPKPPVSTPGNYVVVFGDTLSGIAAKFHTTLAQLMKWNPQITDPDKIFVNQIIHVSPPQPAPKPKPQPSPKPPTTGFYTVKPGEVLSRIALAFHTTVGALMALNRGVIVNPDEIRAGQVIRVPAGPKPPTPAPATRYVVQRGDTLSAIAAHFHKTIAQLVSWNPIISDPDRIRVGWTLRVA